MAKEPTVNDNIAQEPGRQPKENSGDKPNPQQLQGKALQVNENSVEDQGRPGSPARPHREPGDKHNQQTLEGKALQVNENSVEDKGPARSQ